MPIVNMLRRKTKVLVTVTPLPSVHVSGTRNSSWPAASAYCSAGLLKIRRARAAVCSGRATQAGLQHVVSCRGRAVEQHHRLGLAFDHGITRQLGAHQGAALQVDVEHQHIGGDTHLAAALRPVRRRGHGGRGAADAAGLHPAVGGDRLVESPEEQSPAREPAAGPPVLPVDGYRCRLRAVIDLPLRVIEPEGERETQPQKDANVVSHANVSGNQVPDRIRLHARGDNGKCV